MVGSELLGAPAAVVLAAFDTAVGQQPNITDRCYADNAANTATPLPCRVPRLRLSRRRHRLPLRARVVLFASSACASGCRRPSLRTPATGFQYGAVPHALLYSLLHVSHDGPQLWISDALLLLLTYSADHQRPQNSSYELSSPVSCMAARCPPLRFAPALDRAF